MLPEPCQLEEPFKEHAKYFVGVSPRAQDELTNATNPESCFGLDPKDCDEWLLISEIRS